MSEERWREVDRYFEQQLLGSDPVLDAALEDSRAAGLPSIQVSPAQGKLLMLLAGLLGARRILEIGTLGGYSTIWLGRALPRDGRLITLEAEPRHAEVARRNLDRAGQAEVVDVRVGRALELLPALRSEAPFDFVFIDADKQSTADYFRWALELSRAGSAIVVDNVVRKGAIVEGDSGDDRVAGMRRFVDAVAAEPRVSATVVQTVGDKGYDGFALIRVERGP